MSKITILKPKIMMKLKIVEVTIFAKTRKKILIFKRTKKSKVFDQIDNNFRAKIENIINMKN